ncbi:MAG: hypothetical protein V3T77_09680, partial [Planctomycetota bacterium]
MKRKLARTTVVQLLFGGFFFSSVMMCDVAEAQPFIRGDSDGNTAINLADGLDILLYLYLANDPPIPVPDAGDVNDNGVVEIADVAYLLSYIFQKTVPPPEPFPDPGVDSTPPDFPMSREESLVFRVETVAAAPDASAETGVFLTNSVPVQAVGQRIVYDTEVLSLLSVNKEPILELIGEPPSFFNVESRQAGVISVGLMPSYFLENYFPSGIDQEFFSLIWEVAEDAPLEQFSEIRFEDEPDEDPPVYNLVSIDGEVQLPEFESGGVMVTLVRSFVRGDANGDGFLNVADAISSMNYMFGTNTILLLCEDALDANDDSSLNIGDPIFVLNRLFSSGPPLPPPFPNCGIDL